MQRLELLPQISVVITLVRRKCLIIDSKTRRHTDFSSICYTLTVIRIHSYLSHKGRSRYTKRPWILLIFARVDRLWKMNDIDR